MKVRIATVFVLSTLFTLAAAQEEHQPTEPAMVPPTNLTPPPRADPMTPLMVQRLQAMQTHWEKMRQTEDPATRLRLMQEHRETMGETATMMRGIMHAQGMLPLLERVEAMQADMDEILATEDTDLRHKLIEQHLEKMRETNAMLRSVMGDAGRLAIKGGAGLGPLGGMGGGHDRHHARMSAKGSMHGSMHPMPGGRHGRAPAPESLRQLRTDLDEILQTEDPAERQERLLALSASLDAAIAPKTGRQAHEGAKHGMSGGQHKMHGKMHGKGPHHGDGGFHERVEKRLELIQALVEQLLEYHIRD